MNRARPTSRPRRHPRTQAQDHLLDVLRTFGPSMETHALHWKSNVRSERLFWSSIEKLAARGDLAIVEPGVVRITDQGRRSS